jgi:hypothetical protein
LAQTEVIVVAYAGNQPLLHPFDALETPGGYL